MIVALVGVMSGGCTLGLGIESDQGALVWSIVDTY